jgi:tRNA-modifying protein YgfZ
MSEASSGRADAASAQRRAVREGALLSRPDLGTLVVTGGERQSWLNGLVTCELKGLVAGQGARGLVCSKQGRVQAEVWVVLGDDRLFLGVRRDRVAWLRETFDHHLIMEDAEIADASADHAWLLCDGPLSGALVPVARGAGAVAAEIDRSGLGGAAVVAPAADLEAVASALLGHRGGEVLAATEEGWRQLRVELMLPEQGVDYDEQVYPQEAALEERAVSFQKGCYLGQEAVFMIQHRGHPPKRLVQLRVDGDAAVPPGTPLSAAGAPSGTVTSSAPAPEGGATLALGYLKYKHAEVGTAVDVAGRHAEVRIGRAPAPAG